MKFTRATIHPATHINANTKDPRMGIEQFERCDREVRGATPANTRGLKTRNESETITMGRIRRALPGY